MKVIACVWLVGRSDESDWRDPIHSWRSLELLLGRSTFRSSDARRSLDLSSKYALAHTHNKVPESNENLLHFHRIERQRETRIEIQLRKESLAYRPVDRARTRRRQRADGAQANYPLVTTCSIECSLKRTRSCAFMQNDLFSIYNRTFYLLRTAHWTSECLCAVIRGYFLHGPGSRRLSSRRFDSVVALRNHLSLIALCNRVAFCWQEIFRSRPVKMLKLETELRVWNCCFIFL